MNLRGMIVASMYSFPRAHLGYIFLSLLGLGLLAGFTGKGGYSVGPTHFPNAVNPLTGLPVDDTELLERRPMAIKITNYPRSVRPQWGLNSADHTYEYFIGDDMTRFIGVFYGQDASRVGPVRSARLFDEQVMRMYRAFFIFGYADARVRKELNDPDLQSFLIFETPNNCPPLCRYDNGLSYNNLFADTAGLTNYFQAKGKNNDRPNLDGLLFESAIPLGGDLGEAISIEFTHVSYHRWQFDAEQGRYLRFQEEQNGHGHDRPVVPLIDDLDGKQVAADNLVVLYTRHVPFFQSSTTRIWDMPLAGKGIAFAFRDGRAYPLVWKRLGASDLLTLCFQDGSPYPFKPGNIWYEVLGESSPRNRSRDGAWQFDFQIP